MEFNSLIKTRRSIYTINDNVTIDDGVLLEAFGEAIANAPTAFDSRATHVIVALGDKHHFVWDLTKKTLQAIVPAPKFASTEAKLKMFDKGYGTILVFKDEKKIDDLKKQYPGFANRQDAWGEQNVGILVYALWLTIYNLGLSGSIQHYDPLIDEGIAKAFKVEEGWKLETEMVFGKAYAPAGEKDFDPLEDRITIVK